MYSFLILLKAKAFIFVLLSHVLQLLSTIIFVIIIYIL